MTLDETSQTVDQFVHKAPEMAGTVSKSVHHVTPKTVVESKSTPIRPLSSAWMSDELIERTRHVWEPYYGQDIPDADAIEILTNLKRLAEVLITFGTKKE
ncbi:MAG: hypothetical protein SGI77_22800 [Pirellulaceae bacterium]|nr:hypothetical protein [Pirellulaceae bacterium]